jgi:hypothetical protein
MTPDNRSDKNQPEKKRSSATDQEKLDKAIRKSLDESENLFEAARW